MLNRPVTSIRGQEARHDEVLDRVDAEHLQGVELLAHLARTEVGGDRRAGHARDHDRGDQRPQFADHDDHEELSQTVKGTDQDEEVGRLEPGAA